MTVQLVHTENNRLALIDSSQPNAHPLLIDFESKAHNFRRLKGGGNGQLIAKAVGLKTYKDITSLKVIDATAGFGQDAFVLAALGCRVHMIEQNPLIAQLLQSALDYPYTSPCVQTIVSNQLSLHSGSAVDFLTKLPTNNYPDVIYLDPMFPASKKSAKPKQAMVILQKLVGHDTQNQQLLPLARTTAKRRIVVKRPAHAPYLNCISPHASYQGKSTRFDIYMPTRK